MSDTLSDLLKVFSILMSTPQFYPLWSSFVAILVVIASTLWSGENSYRNPYSPSSNVVEDLDPLTFRRKVQETAFAQEIQSRRIRHKMLLMCFAMLVILLQINGTLLNFTG